MSTEKIPRQPELFTATEVATFCQVDLKTIHNWANKGTIEHFRTPGRHLRFRRLDLIDFFRRFGYPIPLALRVSKARVLVIDHEPETLGSLQRALGSRFDLTCFEDPFDALIAIGSMHPHVMIVDVYTPYVDGVRMLEKLKSTDTTCHVRVIVYSRNQQLFQPCLNAGANAFVAKPDIALLRTTLNSLLGLEEG